MKFLRTSVSPVCGLLLVLILMGCATSRVELKRFQFEQPQMGVPFKIIMYASSEMQAKESAEAAFKKIAELNQIMSDYETDSELNELSRTSGSGTNVAVSPDLWKVLHASQEMAKETGGAFDITLGPCISIWRKARREQQLPEQDRLQRAFQRVGYTNLVLDTGRQSATLLKPGMRLDLGGIAKGYAADVALQVLRERGITRALVAASGDISTSDAPPSTSGWRVELTGYDASGGPQPLIVYLRNASAATSGDVFQRLEMNGIRYSHILDPRTGVGLTNHSLVSVVAPTGLESDPMATTLCILPPDDALAYAEKKKLAARIIQQTPQGLSVRETKAFVKLRRHAAKAIPQD